MMELHGRYRINHFRIEKNSCEYVVFIDRQHNGVKEEGRQFYERYQYREGLGSSVGISGFIFS